MIRLLLVAALLTAQTPTIDVQPRMAFAPATVRVRTLTPRDERNRSLCVVYASDVGSNSESCWPLEGEHAAVTDVRYYVLPGGEYDFASVVYRAGAPEVWSAREHVRVISQY